MKTIRVCVDIEVPDDYEPRDGCTQLRRWLDDVKQYYFSMWTETLADLGLCMDHDTRRKGIYEAAIGIYKEEIRKVSKVSTTVQVVCRGGCKPSECRYCDTIDTVLKVPKETPHE